MTENSQPKSKQTTMGNYFTRSNKEKEKTDKSEKPKTDIDRKTRFRQTEKKESEWTSGWSTGWSSWMATDWKKKDVEDYRNEYPGKKDKLNENDNLKFYQNKMKSYPDGDYIEKIHKDWWGQYTMLERHHGYIQWLFPIRESGMNFHAQELQLHEAEKIKEDPVAHRRVLKSYKLMLDFYGMKMKDEVTGELEKSENWKERFQNLNRSFHNYLRITRILKCLGELGYEHIKVKFLEFIIEEALEKKTLKNCYKSCKDYWVETLRNDQERKYIKEYMRKVEEGYESDGDPVDDNKMPYTTSAEVEMEDDSQEMKYHLAETGSLTSQMSVENTVDSETVQQPENKNNNEKDNINDPEAMDAESSQKGKIAELSSSDMEPKQENVLTTQSGSVQKEDDRKTTESQVKQSNINLEKV